MLQYVFTHLQVKKITCGKVYKTSDSKAMVGINREKAIHIKGGMEARLVDEERR